MQIQLFGPGAGPEQAPSAAQDAAASGALRAQPGTLHDVAVYQNQVKVPGIAGHVNAQAFGGGAAWTGYGMIAGRWYDAPGEVFQPDNEGDLYGSAQTLPGTAHTGVPASFTQVFPPSRLALLSLVAVVIAVAGALLPASWAVRARPAVALRAE